MRMLAYAGSAPSVDVKAFTTHKPVLTYLFRAPRDKHESLAVALLAIILNAA